MNVLDKDRLRIYELRELAKEIAEPYVMFPEEIPSVKFINANRLIYGYYDRYDNVITVNPIWNGVDTRQISYTFLHEFVHYIQIRELNGEPLEDSHDWNFLKKLYSLIKKYGIKYHYYLLIEEVLFYRFKLPRDLVQNFFSKYLRINYTISMEDHYGKEWT